MDDKTDGGDKDRTERKQLTQQHTGRTGPTSEAAEKINYC